MNVVYGFGYPDQEMVESWDTDGSGYLSKDEVLSHILEITSELDIEPLSLREASQMYDEVSNSYAGGNHISYDDTGSYSGSVFAEQSWYEPTVNYYSARVCC